MRLKRLLVVLLLPALIGTALAARNGSGTYNVPNVFAPGGVISSAKENANFSDLGNEITNSLPRDGQAGMTGPMRSIDGTTAQPSMSFNNETGSGFRRAASGDMRLVINGVDVLQITSAGINVMSGSLTGVSTLVPVGTILDYVTYVAPPGYLLADGSCQSTATYPALSSVMGANFGSFCPGGQFAMPNAKGRVTAGYDAMGGISAGQLPGAFGAMLGEATHVLTQAEMPQHQHTGTTGGMTANAAHTHNYDAYQPSGSGAGITTGGVAQSISGQTRTSTLTNTDHGHNFTTDVTGSSLGHNNVQPTLIVYKIVKY